MKEYVWRLINKYGKTMYFTKNCITKWGENSIFQDNDKYNLERSNIYFDKLSINDPRVKNKQILDYFSLAFLSNSFEENYYFEDDDNLNSEELFQKYKRFPLKIFFSNNILTNRDILLRLIDEYPIVIYTFLKGKYRQYLSNYTIATLLITYHIYPLIHLTDNLLKELFKSREYTIKYLIHFFSEGCITYYDEYKDDSEVISKEEKETVMVLEPYIDAFVEDESIFIELIDQLSTLREYDVIEHVLSLYFCEYSPVMECLKNKKEELKIKKTALFEVKALELPSSIDIEEYVKKLLNYLNDNFDKDKINDLTILKIIPNNLLENKDFLIAISNYGYSLSQYSKTYQYNQTVIYHEVKNRCITLDNLPKCCLKDQNFILRLREIRPDILLYVDSSLLNNSQFMINYLKYFSADYYFKLGDCLSSSRSFFRKAINYDSHILFYASDSLLDDAIFMHEMIKRNRNNINFLSTRLKNNKVFMAKIQ